MSYSLLQNCQYITVYCVRYRKFALLLHLSLLRRVQLGRDATAIDAAEMKISGQALCCDFAKMNVNWLA